MLNIFEVLNARKTTKLSIANILKEIASDGSGFTYYRLILESPIDEVCGKSKYWNTATSKSEPFYTYDVEEVLIREDVLQQHQDEISKNLIEEDGAIKGTYEGDLFLDVSESGKVWLDDTSLNARKRVSANERRASKFRKPIQ